MFSIKFSLSLKKVGIIWLRLKEIEAIKFKKVLFFEKSKNLNENIWRSNVLNQVQIKIKLWQFLERI